MFFLITILNKRPDYTRLPVQNQQPTATQDCSREHFRQTLVLSSLGAITLSDSLC
jgi:hypothetical protein